MSHNDITGDKIATKAPTEKYSTGWDRIFNKPKQKGFKEVNIDDIPCNREVARRNVFNDTGYPD